MIDEGNKFLRFNLFADCKNLKEAGFAINCIDIEGASSTKDIEDFIFELSEDGDDPHNELYESVIVEPGNDLELNYLYLKFGKVINGFITIKMKAVCSYGYENEIEVRGDLIAEVKED